MSLFVSVLLVGAGEAWAGTFHAKDFEEWHAIQYRVMAAHFLSHATFGPTLDEIDELAERISKVGRRNAFEGWIDAQFALPPSYHKALAQQMVEDDGFFPDQPGINVRRYRHHAWWHTAIAAEDQLRQRMAWALAQIFVINENGAGFNSRAIERSGEPRWLGVSDYYDMLVRNAFANYRQILSDVTLHPTMGSFLSHVNNPKGDPSIGLFPDENYAREVMQLFSIGLYELQTNGVIRKDSNSNSIDTYDNEDIKSFARVFTGLTYAGRNRFPNYRRNYNQPMQMIERGHDKAEKVLLNGKVLPAGQPGMKDIQAALDNLFHHPNVGPFIARRLIQRFVKSNPSRDYIARVARVFNGNDQGVRGDFRAVIKAVLLDSEAWRSQRYERLSSPLRLRVVSKGTGHTRLREPMLRYTAFIRAFAPLSDYFTGRFMLPSQYQNMNQAPYQAPHVFNFYLPDYQPPGAILNQVPARTIPNGALFAPEFEILTSVMVNRFANRLRADVRDATAQFTLINNSQVGKIRSSVTFDFGDESNLASDPAALMEHLDLLLCHGTMSDNVRKIVANAIATETRNNVVRAKGAILATLTSSACSVSN